MVFEIDYLGQLNTDFFFVELVDESEKSRKREAVRLRDNVLRWGNTWQLIPDWFLFVSETPD